MKRQPGISLTEFGLILALIVLTALPALLFLGNTFNDSLTDSSDLSRANDLFAIMDAKASDPYAGGASIAVSTTSPISSSGSGSNSLPDFGSGFATGTMGDITTSVNGTTLAADALSYLASGGTLADNTSMSSFFGSDWGPISSMLSDMATTGYAIANNEQNYIDGGLLLGIGDGAYLNDIQANQVPTLASSYIGLEGYLSQHYGTDFASQGPSEVQALWTLVENSTGVISYGAKEFVDTSTDTSSGGGLLSGYDSTGFSLLEGHVVGTEFQSGDVYEIPVTTTQASNTLNTNTTTP